MAACESFTPYRRRLSAHANTHTHTAYSENNQQLPGSALLLLLSHNCSRASSLSALDRPSQAANHQQPSWLALPLLCDRPTTEPIFPPQAAAHRMDSVQKHECMLHFHMILSIMEQTAFKRHVAASGGHVGLEVLCVLAHCQQFDYIFQWTSVASFLGCNKWFFFPI